MLVQRLSRIALLLTLVAIVDEGVGEVLAFNMVPDIALAGVAEAGTDVAGVAELGPGRDELV